MHKTYANLVKGSGLEQEISLFDVNHKASYKYQLPKEKAFKMKQKPHREPEREFLGMNPVKTDKEQLTFDSDFECGNLDMVLKPNDNEYDCFMRVDTNTKGHH